MAFGFFLNFEKLSQKVIEEELQKMTNSNTRLVFESENLTELDDPVFIENLHHGAIAVTFIVNLYETALNTIISKRLNWMSNEILRASHSLKLQIICYEYDIDYNELKCDNRFSIMSEVIKVRNDITHFKTNEISTGSWVDSGVTIPMGTSKKPLSEIFTQANIQRYYSGILSFLRLLCSKCDMEVNEDCEIIDCDGRDDRFEFIVDLRNIFDEEDDCDAIE